LNEKKSLLSFFHLKYSVFRLSDSAAWGAARRDILATLLRGLKSYSDFSEETGEESSSSTVITARGGPEPPPFGGFYGHVR
jgi:hypothetical protein